MCVMIMCSVSVPECILTAAEIENMSICVYKGANYGALNFLCVAGFIRWGGDKLNSIL